MVRVRQGQNARPEGHLAFMVFDVVGAAGVKDVPASIYLKEWDLNSRRAWGALDPGGCAIFLSGGGQGRIQAAGDFFGCEHETGVNLAI